MGILGERQKIKKLTWLAERLPEKERNIYEKQIRLSGKRENYVNII